jgi:hypothetical protein
VDARVRQERQHIADQVQRQIFNQAVMADVMERPSDREGESSSEPAASKHWKKWVGLGVIVVVLAIVGAVLGIVLGKGGEDGTSAPSASPTPAPTLPPTPVPTEPPTEAPTGAGDVLQDRLEAKFGPINPGTPQAQAMDWLLNDDPMGFTVDHQPFREVEERFAIAVLYLATNGAGWTNKFGFLDGRSVCKWNDGSSSPDFFSGEGIFCIDNDFVTHIKLGKPRWVLTRLHQIEMSSQS